MLHLFPSDRVAGLLDADRGLTTVEADERRRRYGSNDILGDKRAGWGAIARDTAQDPMVWLLIVTALLFAWLGDYAEASILGLALLPIAGMDAYLHRRTRATTEGLAGRLATSARVLRDGAMKTVPSIELVPGDLVIVEEGQVFPADGILLAGANLQADESTLTGEAMPVRKHAFQGKLHLDETSVDNNYWGAAGTRLLTGSVRQRLVFTGGETLYGEIVRSAREGQHERTPLQHAISSLVAGLVAVAVLICVALAVTRYYQGFGLLDAFLSAVTLAVAALPEEFPVAFTFFLGLGVYRLARRQALVRRAVVVENIGRVTCICSDKTGTITEGKLTLAHLVPVEGIKADELHRIAALASRTGSGDPIDVAILAGATDPAETLLATFPFTEDRRRETRLLRNGKAGFLAVAKGAPETIFAMSTLGREAKAVWLAKTEDLGANGHKVLACARKTLSEWSGGEPDRDFEFLGLLAFEDPVREGVKDAVAKAQGAGIRVIMVTGDHATTAAAIAREIGLGGKTPRIIEGSELKDAVANRLRDFDVMARAIPAQKLDLVRALRSSGEIVAVTGDGVNDVPALQGADVGIAMGERGTRTAREVASIVLLDDNFRTIVRAISEGRQLFRNLKLSFAYLLMVHMPLVATAALIPFAGFPLLYLPMHIVWLELIIHPTALLVFQELPESEALDPVQRNRRLHFFDWREWALITLVGTLVIVLIVVGYERSLGSENNVEHARSMALVALIVASATMTAGLTRLKSRASVIALMATIGSALLLVQVPLFASLLQLSPLHADDWLIASLGGLVVGSLAAFLPSLAGSNQSLPAGHSP
ncbi:MAG TPA: cation-transporting P-type ATPase [Methyloceanibacter sp.]|nr:cation-transporting P-type ATPase [Methyloceanibacter sp.]